MIRTEKYALAHVRDIEQPGGSARVQVLFQNASRVLHRHLVAGERHHLGAELHMQRMKRRSAQFRFGRCQVQCLTVGATPERRDARAPLSLDLRDFPEPLAGADYPFGKGGSRPLFQKFITFAVLLPESFRGGCSFGLRPSGFGPTSRPCEAGHMSPARDRLLAVHPSPPGGDARCGAS